MFKTLKTIDKRINNQRITNSDDIIIGNSESKLKTKEFADYYKNNKASQEPETMLRESFIDLEIKAIKIESDATANINWHGKDLEKINIYDPSSATNERAVEIIKDSMYKSIVFVDPKSNKQISSYDFYYQKDGANVNYNFHPKQANKIETMPLFSFGGFYKPGVSIDSIEQVFIQLIKSENDKVTIYPSKRSFWEASGCPINKSSMFKKNKVIFPGFYGKEYHPTIAQFIRSGGIKIKSTDLEIYKILTKEDDIIEEKTFASYEFIMLSENSIRIMLRHN